MYVIEACLRTVIEGSGLKSSDKLILPSLGCDLRNCLETLKALGHDPDVMPDKAIEVVKRLLFHLYNHWRPETVMYTEKIKELPGIHMVSRFPRNKHHQK